MKRCLVLPLSQPYFERVWGWDSHSRNGDLGVLHDSWNFRVWLHESKHLALGCSLYHWKAIKIGSLTSDHQKSGIDPTLMRAGGVQHTVGNLSMRATTLLQNSSQSEVWAKSYSPAKLRESKPWQFRDSSLGVMGQKAIRMWVLWGGKRILYRGRWWLSLNPGHGESCESRIAHGLS
jgi:hypothetical protein